MNKFVVTLHVLSVVFVIGPQVYAALGGYRAIRRHDRDNARAAARMLLRFNAGSVLVALLGFWAVSTSDRFTFRTPWVIISITLWVIMMGLATGYTMPALRKAARILGEGGPAALGGGPGADEPDRPPTTVPEGEEGVSAAPSPVTAPPLPASLTGIELAAKERLDQLAGRIAASGALVTLAAVAITIFMVVKPFGD